MPNPSPRQTEEFKKHCYKPKGAVYSDYPLAAKPTQVRLAEDITAAVDALGDNKTPWLRRVITEAAKRELLGESPPVSPGTEPQLTGDTVERQAQDNSPAVVAEPDQAELVQVLTEVLAVPRLPATARKKLESLLETLSQSQERLPLG